MYFFGSREMCHQTRTTQYHSFSPPVPPWAKKRPRARPDIKTLPPRYKQNGARGLTTVCDKPEELAMRDKKIHWEVQKLMYIHMIVLYTRRRDSFWVYMCRPLIISVRIMYIGPKRMQIRLSKEYTELDGCFRRCRTVLFLRSAVKTRKTKTQKGFFALSKYEKEYHFFIWGVTICSRISICDVGCGESGWIKHLW